MRLIVCGGRSFANFELIGRELTRLHSNTWLDRAGGLRDRALGSGKRHSDCSLSAELGAARQGGRDSAK
jgi:hypothetical protein